MESRGLKESNKHLHLASSKTAFFGHIDVATVNAAFIKCEAPKLCLVRKSDPQDVRAIPSRTPIEHRKMRVVHELRNRRRLQYLTILHHRVR